MKICVERQTMQDKNKDKQCVCIHFDYHTSYCYISCIRYVLIL